MPNNSGAGVAQAFARYNAALLTLSAHLAADLDLTLSEMVACDHLRLDGPLTPRELARRVRLSSGALTSLIDRLEARGFVKRAPHPSDRRSILVHYLPQEQKVVGRLYAVMESFMEETRKLNEAEAETVRLFLNAMARAVMEVAVPPKR